MASSDVRDWLIDRGVPPAAIEEWRAGGLSLETARAAVTDKRWRGRLRRLLSPNAPLSAFEKAQCEALRRLTEDVIALNGRDRAPSFWGEGPIPWLGNLSPAETLRRPGGIDAVADLVHRLRHGIYS